MNVRRVAVSRRHALAGCFIAVMVLALLELAGPGLAQSRNTAAY